MPGLIALILGGALLATVLVLWLFGQQLHAYVYGRWTREYIHVLINHILPCLGPRGKQWWADRFHGKVITNEQAQAIITIDRDIRVRDLEQIIPYAMARKLVLKGPPDVAVYECPCRLIRENPCQPTQVCMIIGQPFADFILKQHPQRSRRISQEEALEILRAEQERGHVHSAWFKDVMGERFYTLCNCCRCCCFGIEAMISYDAPMVAASGYVAQVNEALCAACATCENACPFEAIQVNGTATVNWEACMGCGVCAHHCPNQAMSLVRDKRKGFPLDVRLLAQDIEV